MRKDVQAHHHMDKHDYDDDIRLVLFEGGTVDDNDGQEEWDSENAAT